MFDHPKGNLGKSLVAFNATYVPRAFQSHVSQLHTIIPFRLECSICVDRHQVQCVLKQNIARVFFR